MGLFDKFKKALNENGEWGFVSLPFPRAFLVSKPGLGKFFCSGLGDQFDDSLILSLLRLIDHMTLKKKYVFLQRGFISQ